MTPIQPSAASPIIHYSTANKPPIPQRPFANSSLLSPDAAFYAHSSPNNQQSQQVGHYSQELQDTVNGETPSLRSGGRSRKRARGRSGSRRRKGVWKKLLWVKQKDCELQILYVELLHAKRNIQIRITTSIRPSSLTSNAIRDYDCMTFGPW